MSYQDLYMYFVKAWVLFLLPVLHWLNKKRKEYVALVERVKDLEGKIDATNTKIDERFDIVNVKIDEDRVSRQKTYDRIDDIYAMLYQLKEDTAINSTILHRNVNK